MFFFSFFFLELISLISFTATQLPPPPLLCPFPGLHYGKWSEVVEKKHCMKDDDIAIYCKTNFSFLKLNPSNHDVEVPRSCSRWIIESPWLVTFFFPTPPFSVLCNQPPVNGRKREQRPPPVQDCRTLLTCPAPSYFFFQEKHKKISRQQRHGLPHRSTCRGRQRDLKATWIARWLPGLVGALLCWLWKLSWKKGVFSLSLALASLSPSPSLSRSIYLPHLKGPNEVVSFWKLPNFPSSHKRETSSTSHPSWSTLTLIFL